MRICTQMDGVPPRAREGETDFATVQGHSKHSSRVSHANTQGEWCLSSLAIVTSSGSPHGYSMPMRLPEAAWALQVNLERWESGTCLLTICRGHGLPVNGGCQRCQLAPPPYLAFFTAGSSI